MVELTPGEKLWVWRRAAGLTQAQARRRLHVGQTTYSRYESDDLPAPPPPDRLRPLTTPLLCALARRRCRLGLREVADLVGVSHVSFLKFEREGDERLVQFWKKTGTYPE